MFKGKIFVSLFGLALVLSGCGSINSGGVSNSRNTMGEYYTIIETGQIINIHENQKLRNARQICGEKAASLFRNKLNNNEEIQDETDRCLIKVGYEKMK